MTETKCNHLFSRHNGGWACFGWEGACGLIAPKCFTPKVESNLYYHIDRCEMYKDMDSKYETSTDSPLHHDNRCAIPGHGSKFILSHIMIVTVS